MSDLVAAVHHDPVKSKVKHAIYNNTIGAGGTATIVAAVAGKRIRVHGLFIGTSAASELFEFRSGAAGTPIGELSGNTTVAVTLPWCPFGWFHTAAGALLELHCTAGGAVKLTLVYSEVD